MYERFLQMLGLAQRAGAITSGAVGCEQALRKGKASLIIVATDAVADVHKEYGFVSEHKGIPLVTISSKAELGNAIGKSSRVAIIVTDPNFGRRLWELSQDIGGGRNCPK